MMPAMTDQPTTVLIVDDHPLVRRGIRQILSLSPSWQVVGEADSGESALTLVAQTLPSLILLDLQMKGISGLQVLEHLREHDFAGKIVLLTMSDSAQDLLNALRLGADGYLLKDSEPQMLLDGLAQVMDDKVVMSPWMSEKLALAIRTDNRPRTLQSLTAREQEIVFAIAEGQSNKRIAINLGLAEGTVKVHVRSLLKKLKFKSRVEIAIWVSRTINSPR